jgi:hypothetical protein
VLKYWGAGYFIAWQNPEMRASYDQPGEALPFLRTRSILCKMPPAVSFPDVRVLCALPVIHGSGVGPWGPARVVGLLCSVPQNVGHIIANPWLPIASARLSHLIDTASSIFAFGAIVGWRLHREHHSMGNRLGMYGTEQRHR